MRERLVVFGGSGFVGSALRAGLGGRVVAPSRPDVNLNDEISLRRYLQPDDLVINAAGYASATDRSPEGLRRLRRDNVDGVCMLARVAADCGASGLIHISSVAAMGQRSGNALTEDQLAPPRSPYGQSKRDGEMVLASFRGELPVTILRPTSVFGEGRPLAAILCRLASLPIVPLPEGGRALVPFTYIGNVVEAVRLAVDTPACRGHTYIVGDRHSYRLDDIVRGLARGLGRSSEARIVGVPRHLVMALAGAEAAARRLTGSAPALDSTRVDTMTQSISYSIEAFERATGYAPLYSLREATALIGAWYRQSGR